MAVHFHLKHQHVPRNLISNLFFCSNCFRVRLLVNRQTEEAVAVKVIDTSQAKECADNVKKEVCIHKVGWLFFAL